MEENFLKDKFKCDKRCGPALTYKNKTLTNMWDLYGLDSGSGMLPVMFRDINLTSMILNISDEAFKKAKEILDNKLTPFLQTDTTNSFYWFGGDKEKNSFDFIEQLFVAVIFAYTAVECFVNNCIPENFEEERQVSKNGVVTLERVNKDWITRYDTLDHKLKSVLPPIYKYKFEANELSFWQEFKILKNLRDNSVHPKTLKGACYPTQIKFLAEFFHQIMNENIIDSARKMVEYLSMQMQNAPTGIKPSPFIPLEFCEKPTDLEDYYAFTDFSFPEQFRQFLENAK